MEFIGAMITFALLFFAFKYFGDLREEKRKAHAELCRKLDLLAYQHDFYRDTTCPGPYYLTYWVGGKLHLELFKTTHSARQAVAEHKESGAEVGAIRLIPSDPNKLIDSLRESILRN